VRERKTNRNVIMSGSPKKNVSIWSWRMHIGSDLSKRSGTIKSVCKLKTNIDRLPPARDVMNPQALLERYRGHTMRPTSRKQKNFSPTLFEPKAQDIPKKLLRYFQDLHR